ncbi:MAG: hypothetical protein AAF497_07575, partial [Planctomycetota bacterium]
MFPVEYTAIQAISYRRQSEQRGTQEDSMDQQDQKPNQSEKKPQDSNGDGKQNGPPIPAMFRRGNPNMWLIGALLILMLLMVAINQTPQPSEIREDFFIDQLSSGNVAEVNYIGESKVIGRFKIAPDAPKEYNEEGELVPPTKQGQPVKLKKRFFVILDPQVSEAQREQFEGWYREFQVNKKHSPAEDSYGLLMAIGSIILPLILLVFLWNMFRRTRDQFMGGGFLSGFSKSTARRYDEAAEPITFADVAGLEGVKSDLQEIVDFLKAPEKFQRLGGRVPKGV